MLSHQIWGNKCLSLKPVDDLSTLGYACQTLLTILQSNLIEINSYRAYFPDNGFDVYIGKTQDSDWFGICSRFHYDRHNAYGGGHLKTNTSFPSGAALHLIGTIEKAGFPLARGYNFEKWMWEVAETREQIIEKLLTSVGFLIIQEFQGIQRLAANFASELQDIEEHNYSNSTYYYDPEADIEYDIDAALLLGYPPEKDYRDLDEFLQSTLTNLRVYIIGATSSGEFDIYVLGSTQDGDWAGVLVDVELNP